MSRSYIMHAPSLLMSPNVGNGFLGMLTEDTPTHEGEHWVEGLGWCVDRKYEIADVPEFVRLTACTKKR